MSWQPLRLVGRIPDPIWAPASASVVMLAIGLLGVATGEPWLFPSLGPTAFMQAEFPEHPTTDVYHTVVGHLIGIGAGIGAVLLLGAQDAPAIDVTGDLVPIRVWAAALSVAATILLTILLRASHPPAASTTLLFSLGALDSTWREAGLVIAGIVLVALLGYLVRLLRLPARRLGDADVRGHGGHRGPAGH